jgi:hypothetical protein
MWRHVDLVWTDVSEESRFTQITRRHIPEDGILHSHRRENIKSYIQSHLGSRTSRIMDNSVYE